MNLIKEAVWFAHEAHRGQLRRYTGEPYIVHPLAVAGLVETVAHTRAMTAAALLHDVVEDTPVSLQDIRTQFGMTVASYVSELTDISVPEDGNRALRKQLDLQHLKRASVNAKTIKLADLIHNSGSIIAYGKGFKYVFLKEMRILLDEALREGDATLWAKADKIITDNLEKKDGPY